MGIKVNKTTGERKVGTYFPPVRELVLTPEGGLEREDEVTVCVSDFDQEKSAVSLVMGRGFGEEEVVSVGDGSKADMLAGIDELIALLQAARSWVVDEHGNVPRSCEKCGAQSSYQAKVGDRWTYWCGCDMTPEQRCQKASGGVHVKSERDGSCVFCGKEAI